MKTVFRISTKTVISYSAYAPYSMCLLRKLTPKSLTVSLCKHARQFCFPSCSFLRFKSSSRPISDSQLRVSLRFHLCPINLVVFKGSST